MQLPKYFFVYVLFDEVTGVETHVVTGDNWTTLVRTKAFVESGVQVSRLLYLSNVKDGTHHQRLARGEVPPQSKSPFRVAALRKAVDPRVAATLGEPHHFVNAGIGLTPDSVCALCTGLASDHPDMEAPLSVMACVKHYLVASKDPAPEDTGGKQDPPAKPREVEDGPAPCEDEFQGGAGGESGPHVATDTYGDDLNRDEEMQERLRDSC